MQTHYYKNWKILREDKNYQMINCKEKVFRIYRENLISLDRKINNMMTYLVKSRLIQVIFIIYSKNR